MAISKIPGLCEITSSNVDRGTQYCIRFPFAKLQIIVGKAVYQVSTYNSVDGKIAVSDWYGPSFSKPFSTVFGGTVSKDGGSSNTGIYNTSVGTNKIQTTFWRGVDHGVTPQEMSYIAIGLYS